VLTRLARFTKKVITLAQKTVVGNAKPALQRGDGGYVDWVIVSIHDLETYLDLPFRRLLDVLYEMPRISLILGLEPTELPDFLTVCSWMQGLKMPVWRRLLQLSAELHDTGEIQAIDATGSTGVERVGATRNGQITRSGRSKRRFSSSAVRVQFLDIHCSMKRPHDTQIGDQVLTRNLDRVETITADTGYDWDELRRNLKENDVRPVIKHRKFSSLEAAHNARLDDETYHRRSVVESVIRSLKRRFGDTIQARTWFGQFREPALKAAVKNIEAALSP